MIIRHNLAFVLFFSSLINIYSQNISWERSYGGKEFEILNNLIITPDNSILIAGSSTSNKGGNKTENNNGNLDYWICKMNDTGEILWQKNYGGSGFDLLDDIIYTSDGGFILAGTSSSKKEYDKKEENKGNNDYWIIKTDSRGNEIWQRTIGGYGNDKLLKIIQTKDGGYLLGGVSNSCKGEDKLSKNYGALDYWVVKLNESGVVEWERTYGGIYNDELCSIIEANEGGFIIGGSSNSPEGGIKNDRNFGEYDYWIIKINNNGEVEWQNVIGSTGDDRLTDLKLNTKGHLILGGITNSQLSGLKSISNKNGTDYWIINFNLKDKEILWQETFDIGKIDVLSSIIINSDDTILLGGYSQGETKSNLKDNLKKETKIKLKKGSADYCAMLLDIQGLEKWRIEIDSDGEDILKKVIETRDGEYLFAGTTSKQNFLNKKAINGKSDFWLVKLKDENKLKNIISKIEAFPNPTESHTNLIINYAFEKAQVTLVDLSGRIIQQFETSERIVLLDISQLPDGIYVVNVKTEKENEGIKIIKNKQK